MVLTKKEIIEQIDKRPNSFIDPVNLDNIQSASYDLTLGDEYYICSDKEIPDIKRLDSDENLIVPPRATFFVISKEKLYIPLDICAEVSLAFGLIKKGIVFAVQPPIDPGYHGAIVALMHNMSDEEIVLEHGRHILNVVYHKLISEVPAEDGYKGDYNDITLGKFCTTAVKHSAIVTLTDEAKEACYQAKEASNKAAEASDKATKASNKAAEASHKTLSTIITIITIMLAIITVFMTAATIYFSIQALKPSKNITSSEAVYEETAFVYTDENYYNAVK